MILPVIILTSLLKEVFLVAGFYPLASNFELKNKLKSPAKITFFSKVTSKFSKSEDNLFKTEDCSISVLQLYKFIKANCACIYKKLKRCTSLSRYCY